jgi:hypothetical protein
VDNVDNLGAWVKAGPVTLHAVTKYYTHGSQRVAMRQGAVVYYLSGDHLGSTSLTTDDTGDIVSEVRYLPYGEACPECILSLTKGLSKGTLDQRRHPDRLHLHRPA